MKEALLTFWQGHSESIISISYNIMLACIILLVSRSVAKMVRQAVQKSNQRLKHLDTTVTPILASIADYGVYTIAGVFILDIFGVNTASLIALLGAAGLTVGLALKDTLSNIAAGIMLLVLRPFKAGDFIEYGSIQGTVNEINLFTTILETVDGLYIASPNSNVWGSSIKNFTRNGRRRMDIIVGIAYSDSIEQGLKVLASVAKSENRLLTDPAPQTMVLSMGESAVNIQLRAWAKNEDYWTVYWELNRNVKDAIEYAGLTIPFPQRSLHIVTGDLKEK